MRFLRFLFPPIVALLAAVFAAAAFDGLQGPSLGFLTAADGRAPRPIRGIPGAATWGATVDLGPDVSTLAVAPRRDAAVVLTGAGLRTVDLGAGAAPALTDPGLPSAFHPTAAAFSPDGATAALYDRASATLWLLAGGHASPVDLSALPGPAARLAVSGGPDPAVALVPDGAAQSVFVLDAKGGNRVIAPLGDVAAIAFVGQSRDLAIADRGARRLLLVRDPLSGGAPLVLLDHLRAQTSSAALAGGRLRPPPPRPALLDGPLDVASSADGRSLGVVAANSVAGIFNLESSQWAPFACQCAGAALAPLRGNAIFAIGRAEPAAGQPLWILDGDSSPPRMAFVPAPSAEGQP